MLSSNPQLRSYLNTWRWPLGFVLLGLLVNLALATSLESLVLPQMTGVFLKLRMADFLEKYAAMHTEGSKLVYFWGASEIEEGLNTGVIDKIFVRKKLDYKSVNLGMRSVHPTVYRAFIERVARELQEHNLQIEVSLVKIPINKLTQTFTATYSETELVDQVGAVLVPTDWRFARLHFPLYMGSLGSHYLLNDASLAVPYELLSMELARFNPARDGKPLKAFFEIWSNRLFMDPEFWNESLRGTYSFNQPRSKEAFSQALLDKRDPVVRYASYSYFERCCGMNSLRFDDKAVSEFIETIRLLKQVSKKVYIYSIPETVEFNLWRKNNYGKKIDALLELVSKRTGVEVIDGTSKVDLDDGEDYIDFLHLSEKGQDKYYSFLFDKIIWAQ